MARRGVMNALQAALAGASGAAGGYVQMQETKKRDLERAKEMERQALRDALASEQLGLQRKEFEARFGPEAIERAERIRREEAATKLSEAEKDRVAAMRRAALGLTEAREKRTAEDRAKEVEGLAYLSTARGNPAVARALGAVFQSCPDLARRPGLAAYELLRYQQGEEETALKFGRENLEAPSRAGGSPGASMPPISTPATGGKPVISRAEYDQLIAEGQDSRRILEKYEVRG